MLPGWSTDLTFRQKLVVKLRAPPASTALGFQGIRRLLTAVLVIDAVVRWFGHSTRAADHRALKNPTSNPARMPPPGKPIAAASKMSGYLYGKAKTTAMGAPTAINIHTARKIIP
jgi:hypothetical protein